MKPWISGAMATGRANLAVSVGLLLGVFIATAYSPLADMHAFRQTQTAMSVWWMGHGGSLIAYETPILGKPWTVPFELPTFQLLALLVWKLGGQTIEFSGRITSVLAMLLAIWPIYRLGRRISPDPLLATSLSAVIVTAPVILFWSRSFMLESTALLLAVGWLSLLLDAVERPAAHRIGGSILLGSLASATKITTFAPFFGLGLLLVIWQARRSGRLSLLSWAGIAAGFLLPVVAGLAWADYADSLKMGAPLARRLTSEALHGWNFGTFADRQTAEFAMIALVQRPMAVLGPVVFALPLLLVASLWRNRVMFTLALLCIFTYLGAFLLFAKLYTRHDYYQVAVAPLLCASAVIALWSLTEGRHRAWFLAGVLALQLSQLAYFGMNYVPILAKNDWTNSLVRTGRVARNHTAAGEGILVVGTGYNSTIPFYAERRSVALPPWVSPKQLSEMFAHPQVYFGDAKLTLAIKCSYKIASFKPVKRRLIEDYFDELEPVPEGKIGSCRSYYVR